jgi:Rad3-related DNA helicase
MESPAEFGLPFDHWLKNQDVAAEDALRAQQRIRVYEMPTGNGKSGLPALVSRFRNTTTMVATRDLQQQYAESFDWMQPVWGRSHYQCTLPSRIETFKDLYGFNPSCADCNQRTRSCPTIHTCEYERAKADAKISGSIVLNYAYAFYTKWWHSDGLSQDIFCDEAHDIPNVISGLVSVQISQQQRQKYDLPDFPLISGSDTKSIRDAQRYFEECAEALLDYRILIDEMGGDIMENERVSTFSDKITFLSHSLSKASPDSWYIESARNRRFVARPIDIAPYAGAILNPEAKHISFMSATIGNPEVLCDQLGLPTDDIRFLSLPHSFPKRNRPVVWVKQAPAMNARSTYNDYAKQADLIIQAFKHHKGEKGIIHVASWKQCETIASILQKRGHGDRVMITRGPRLKTIEKFRHSDPGTVAISPSWTEGLNFPDDEARFCIIAKVPFLSLADPVTRIKLHSPNGRAWYDWIAATKVVQASGRIVRHKEDWGVTYIMDSNWRRVMRMAPSWYEVSEA